MSGESKTVAIRDSLHSIAKQLDSAVPKARLSSDVKASASKIYQILLEGNCPVERFYFIYSICQVCIDAKPTKVDKLLKAILPSSPTAHSMALISDLISFALCHPSTYSQMLDYTSSYLNASDLVTIDVESWNQARTLALDSPDFCSALLSRPDLARMNIDKRLLARWLHDLSKVERDFTNPSLNQLIRYSLFHLNDSLSSEEAQSQELANSDLHLGILTLIQSRRCQTLTNQFLIDVVSNLAPDEARSDEAKRPAPTLLIDRFAQILSVAAANKVTTITNALRNWLSKLESNQLIFSVMNWPK